MEDIPSVAGSSRAQDANPEPPLSSLEPLVDQALSSDTIKEPPAPAHLGDAQCPVSHAASQPLPPGHPPVPNAPSSSLQQPTDPRCVFFRTQEDLNTPTATPPLSRQASITKAEQIAAANINPLKEGEGSTLDPNKTLVLASRNSQLALVQSSQVSRMLAAHYGDDSPFFHGQASSSSSSSNGISATGKAIASSSSSYSSSRSASPTSPVEPLTPQELSSLERRIQDMSIKEPMSFPITSMSTAGDQNLRSPLYVIGGEGRAIWTKELEVALAAGGVDAIVHCLKDVPTSLPDNFVLGAVLEREDPRDALVMKQGLPYKTLDELPKGSVIGTSSVRRVAQLRRRYPGLVFSDVRGNLNTRINKLDAPTGPYTALVLAAAGLIRINLAHRITAFLSSPVLLYSVGQGSLTIEVRKPPPGSTPSNNRDARILAMIQSIGDWRATARAETERALLKELEGGCSIPVGVETWFEDHEEVEGVRNEKIEEAEGVEGKEGHTITKAAVAEMILQGAGKLKGTGSANSGRPQTLERLATGAPTSSSTTTQRNTMEDYATPALATPAINGKNGPPGSYPFPTAATSSNPSDLTSTRSIEALLRPSRAEDRSQPPSSPIELHLTAIIVSLDGQRHCEFKASASISSLEEARELGISVAHELKLNRGGKTILEEVERHRKMAEEADERRKVEREKRKQREREEEAAEGKGAEEGGPKKRVSPSLPRGMSGSSPLSKTTVEEESLQQVMGHYPQVANGEVDKRGVPREDGQEKVWEV